MPTRAEWLSRHPQPDDRLDPASLDRMRQLLHVAEVRAATLTQHPAWDFYLQHCQALLDEIAKQVDRWGGQCVQPQSAENYQVALVNYHRAQARFETIHELMQLPHSLLAKKEHDDVGQAVALQ